MYAAGAPIKAVGGTRSDARTQAILVRQDSPIKSAADIVVARQKGRALAVQMGFSGSDPTVIAAAISEVARNIVNHAVQGEVILSGIHESSRLGIQVVARDEGPGIADIEQAMQYGYSSGKVARTLHDYAGWLMLPIAFLLLLGLIRILEWTLLPVKRYTLASQ